MKTLILGLFLVLLFVGCEVKQRGISPMLNLTSCLRAESEYDVLIEKYKGIDDKFLHSINGTYIKTASSSDIKKGIGIFTEYETVGKRLLQYCERSVMNSSIWYGAYVAKLKLVQELTNRNSH